MLRLPDGWGKCVLACLLYVALSQAWACSPSRPRGWSGFVRAGIGHLPKNARGVMFYLASRAPRAQDFRVTSDEDPRPLSVRVHAFKGKAWIRLEPDHGFQPGARYRFRYLPRHADWRYPDEMTVAIDDVEVSSEGDYAIVLAPAPAYKVVIVPTSSGSCVEPSPAIVQAFTYSVPPSMLRYRDALAYAADITRVSRSGAPIKPPPFVLSWTALPSLYETGNGSLGMGYSKQYTTRDNAVVAACGTRWPRIRLTGAVSFPELDALEHRVPAAEFDLDRRIVGRCEPLDALLRTVDWRSPEPSLRELCHANIAGSFGMGGQPLRAVDPGEWARELTYFTGMSATCNLVGLAYLWRTGQYSTQPGMLRELGAAIATGWKWATPADRDAAVHALAYLTAQLPDQLPAQLPAQLPDQLPDQPPRGTRAATARQLLAPLRAALAEAAAAGPHPGRPDDLAKLIALAR